MSDEQTIYISPEDNLTNIRERLEGISSRRVTLVIPKDTLLRGHVAWRNLYARAKELEKDVLIISADAQIRSLAQAAKFRVAHSLESSPTGKTRSTLGRTVRSTFNSRGKTPPPRGAGEARSSKQQATPSPAPPYTRAPYADRPQSTMPDPGKTTGGLTNISPSTFGGTNEQHYARPYDYRIQNTPPIHPLSPQEIDEDPDLLVADVQQARTIREAASQGNKASVPDSPLPHWASPEVQDADELSFPGYNRTRSSEQPEDPFFKIEGEDLPPLPSEQRGQVSVESFGTTEHKMQDIFKQPPPTPAPTADIVNGQFEYQGDLGHFHIETDDPPISSLPHDEIEEGLFSENEQDMVGPSRIYGARPRASRTTRAQQFAKQEPRQEYEQEPRREDRPLPIASPRSSQQGRSSLPTPTTGRTSQKLSADYESPTEEFVRPKKGSTQRQRATRTGSQTRGGVVANRPRTRSTGSQPRQKPVPLTAQQRLRQGAVPITIIVLLLLCVGLLAYLVPSAEVTVTVATRNYTAPVKLTTSAGMTQNTSLGTVPATTLTQTFPIKGGAVTGTGTATGSTKVNTGKASGTVTFTNTGNTPIDVPSNTLIETANGVQFLTGADGYVNITGSAVGNTITVPVVAQQTGEKGNVPAGSITTIPTDSITSIAQANATNTSNIKLTVTNDATISGGGLSNATTVAQADLDKVKQSLRNQVQPDIDAWQKQNVHSGDVSGIPTVTATLVNTPPVGQVVDTGTFNAGLKVTVTLLVVRSADMQKATIAVLNDTLRKNKQQSLQNYTVVADSTHLVTINGIQIKGDTNQTTLNFHATGKIAPNLSASDIQRLILSKSKNEARAIINGLSGVQGSSITVFPDFIPWVPFFAPRVNVQFVPGTTLP